MNPSWNSPLSVDARVGFTLAHEPSYRWVFSALQQNPELNVFLTGEGVLHAVLGKIPSQAHLLLQTPNHAITKTWISRNPAPAYFTHTITSQPVEEFLENEDLTSDTLAYNVRDGLIQDHFGILQELSSGRIGFTQKRARTLYLKPIASLRALRTAAELQLTPHPETWNSILHNLDALHTITHNEHGHAMFATPRGDISQEGIHTLGSGSYGWKLLQQARATPHIFPHILKEDLYAQAEGNILGVYDDHTRTRYVHVDPHHNILTAALFAHHADRSTHYAEHSKRMHHHRVSERIPTFSHEDTGIILKKTHALLTENPSLWSLARAEKILAKEHGDSALSLAHVVSLQKKDAQEHLHHLGKAALLRERLVRDIQPPPLLRGRDLIPLGLTSGPHIRLYLQQLRDEQLKGGVSTKDEALAYIREHLLCR